MSLGVTRVLSPNVRLLVECGQRRDLADERQSRGPKVDGRHVTLGGSGNHPLSLEGRPKV